MIAASASIPRSAPQLQPLHWWCQPPAPPRLAHLRQALADHLQRTHGPGAVPLRWAVTAVDPERGWQVEGVVLLESNDR